jgi:hypothetical protein
MKQVLGIVGLSFVTIFLLKSCFSSISTLPNSNIDTHEEQPRNSDFATTSAETSEKQAKENIEQDEAFLKTKAGRIYKKHKSWDKEDCIKLANGEMWIGMTSDMIVYLRGNPNIVNPSNYGDGEQYQYYWENFTPHYIYCDNNQIVTAYN